MLRARRLSSSVLTAREHALCRIDGVLASAREGFPCYTERGRWVTTPDGGWSGGLWVGQLWLAYEWTGDRRYRDAGLALLPALEARIARADADVDLGFLLLPSFVRGYEIFGDDRFRRIALRGAARMLDFYHERSGMIYTVYPARGARYGHPVGSAIVDIMMNLALLWWAHAETGDSHYFEVAADHAARCRELHVRADGSTFHVVDFDLASGDIFGRGTIHGHGDDSTWARGQAWALHGFALAARAMGRPDFAETAAQLSCYFHERLPADGRCYWDLGDPAIPDAVRDTSAAAIAADGWLKMEGEWPAIGRQVIEALADGSLTPPDEDGVLAGATAYKTQGRGVMGATVWGDYYFLHGLGEVWVGG